MSDFEDVKMDDNSPILPQNVQIEMDSVKNTRGYKCGKCCGYYCDSKNGWAKGTAGLGVAATGGTAVSGLLTGLIACCYCVSPDSCAPPYCMCGTIPAASGTAIVTGGCFVIALACGLKLAIMYLSHTYCATLTHHLGCDNFSQGFDS